MKHMWVLYYQVWVMKSKDCMSLFKRQSIQRNPCQCCGGSLPAPLVPQGQTSSSAVHSRNWHTLSESERGSQQWSKPSHTFISQSEKPFMVPVLTMCVLKGCIKMAGYSFPFVYAARMDVINSILQKVEDPVKRGLEEVDFIHVVLFQLQSCLDISHRKTQLLHWSWPRYLPLSIKHPVALTCHRRKME